MFNGFFYSGRKLLIFINFTFNFLSLELQRVPKNMRLGKYVKTNCNIFRILLNPLTNQGLVYRFIFFFLNNALGNIRSLKIPRNRNLKNMRLKRRLLTSNRLLKALKRHVNEKVKLQ